MPSSPTPISAIPIPSRGSASTSSLLATDSFFMAMFFFLSGLFVWPGLAHKVAGIFLRDRLLRLGLPFAIARVHDDPDRLLRDLAAAAPRDRLCGILVEDDHGRPLAERPGLVRLGVAGVRPARRASLTGCRPACVDPINRLSLRGFDQPAVFFLFLLAVTAVVYIPARALFRRQPLVRVRAVLGPGQPRAALCRRISSSAPASALRISSAACSARTGGWRRAAGAGSP